LSNGDEENRRGFPYNSLLSEVGEEQCCGSGFIESGSGYGPGSNIAGLDDQKLKKTNTVENCFTFFNMQHFKK
jgi:hypothetical protein